ncbi:MAG: leucine--tRNA ligase [Candidatus Nanopelagicales bacterium]
MIQTHQGTSSTDPAVPAYRYDAAVAQAIEVKWQDTWERADTFHAPNPTGALAPADPAAVPARKMFVLDMFPYPSGAGLHVGHPMGYIATDVFGRYQRMNGMNVLHAMGYDAFGLPAEQYAVQTGAHPRVTTEANIANMRRQLRRLGLAHDPRRSVATTDVQFYRWTQWIFLQVFNSWFDPQAAAGHGKARPIAELESELATGARPTRSGTPWAELGPTARRDEVDSYRLAYLSEAPVNWCPGLGTVLANEEVTSDGRSDRGNYPVFKANLKQWKMRITAYADRLLADLARLDWPEPVKLMQANWIGRSTGADVDFILSEGVPAAGEALTVFTTRPDTLYGATFMVVSPEHPMITTLTPAEWPAGTRPAWTGGATNPAEAVANYQRAAAAKTDEQRTAEDRTKTGVFTGAWAINPAGGGLVPVFVADYVLMGYGTGAIMAVPGQDQRDWDFATAYELPVIRTVEPTPGWEGEAFTEDGPAINSPANPAAGEFSLNGLAVREAKAAMIEHLGQRGVGRPRTTYRLRDWLFSRQRYWGEPFPIVYDTDGRPIALPESMLPVELPEITDYSPKTFDPDLADSTPEPPLGRAAEWVNVELDLGEGRKTYRRELNTMPQWAGSCWYELRYLDPTNDQAFVDPVVEKYWMGPDPERAVPGGDPGGVDLYVGGVEHAVLHLLYARFWHKVLFDLGHLSSDEPFRRLFNQGYIQAFAFTDARGVYVPADEVVEDPASSTGFTWKGEPVNREYGKMGKQLKNSVTPDDMFGEYGADTLRVYEMSMGPLDMSKPWDTRAVVGSYRFLQRVWRNVVDEETGELAVVDELPGEPTLRAMHTAIAKVREDCTNLRFNTAIAELIKLNNHLTKLPAVPRQAAETLVLMTAPFVPHLAEELWSKLGHGESLAYESFPVADPAYLVTDTLPCVVQVNGKVRATLEVVADASDDAVRELVLADEAVQRALGGKEVRKLILPPAKNDRRLVSLVV